MMGRRVTCVSSVSTFFAKNAKDKQVDGESVVEIVFFDNKIGEAFTQRPFLCFSIYSTHRRIIMLHKIISISLGIVILTGSSEGLRCYSCFATGGHNECEEFNTYKTAMEGKRPEVKKNCTGPYDQVCVIETYSGSGQELVHIRDCGNGQNFSFTGLEQAKRGLYERLIGLHANNETACVWNGNNMVCLSKCDEDFCNGPQLKEVTNGHDVMNIPSFVIVIGCVLLMAGLHF